jgi:hypothetical protein
MHVQDGISIEGGMVAGREPNQHVSIVFEVIGRERLVTVELAFWRVHQ